MSAATRTGLDHLLASWWTELLNLRREATDRSEHASIPLP